MNPLLFRQPPPFEYKALDFFSDHRHLRTNASDFLHVDDLHEWINNTLVLISTLPMIVLIRVRKHSFTHGFRDYPRFRLCTFTSFAGSILTLNRPCNLLDRSTSKVNSIQLNKYIKNFLLNHTNILFRFDFAPRTILPDDCFNIFTGFYMEGYPEVDGNFEDTLIYKHLAHVFNSDDDELNKFLDFIADILQNPSRVTNTSYMISGVSGSGKSLIGQWLSQVIGEEHAISIHDFRGYRRFNPNRTFKLLKIFENMPDYITPSQFSQIKKEIGSNTEIVRHKQWSDTINSFTRFLLFTTAKTNPSDKFSFHRIPDTRNQRDNFTDLWAEIRDSIALKLAFDFLMSRELLH